MPHETILVTQAERVVTIALNRPPMNPISNQMITELNTVLDGIENDGETRALILTGAGEKAFCAGADITEFGQAFGEGSVKALVMTRHKLFTRIEKFPKPVIAAINGYALGGGCELAMACHLRLVADTATIGQPEINLGIIPGYGGTQRLPRLIGRTRAYELLFLGDRIPAQRALEIGLVNKVCPAGSLMDDARELAARLAKQAPVAIKLIIDCVNRGLETTIENGLEIEADNMAAVSATEDAMEGVMAFMQKRQPDFKGK
ncbi:MAG: enoyl-CoA hydratase/isomerase family protein [Candidatus Lindowbacteria bacterium]|nr:enoyl-CoA hydratase/isomerase family protein [Candidatus Lindowbacteria bacterium]